MVKKYNPEIHLWKARSLALTGMKKEDIAKWLEIPLQTLRTWMKRYPEFKAAIREGWEVPTSKVERSLIKGAIGYFWTERSEEDGPNGKTTKKVRRHQPGSTAAQIFMLKNMKPNRWKNEEAPHEEKGDSPINRLAAMIAAQRAKPNANGNAEHLPQVPTPE